MWLNHLIIISFLIGATIRPIVEIIAGCARLTSNSTGLLTILVTFKLYYVFNLRFCRLLFSVIIYFKLIWVIIIIGLSYLITRVSLQLHFFLWIDIYHFIGIKALAWPIQRYIIAGIDFSEAYVRVIASSCNFHFTSHLIALLFFWISYNRYANRKLLLVVGNMLEIRFELYNILLSKLFPIEIAAIFIFMGLRHYLIDVFMLLDFLFRILHPQNVEQALLWWLKLGLLFLLMNIRGALDWYRWEDGLSEIVFIFIAWEELLVIITCRVYWRLLLIYSRIQLVSWAFKDHQLAFFNV